MLSRIKIIKYEKKNIPARTARVRGREKILITKLMRKRNSLMMDIENDCHKTTITTTYNNFRRDES